MEHRQTLPRQWLVADDRLGRQLWAAVRALPPGSGILFLYRDLPIGERARLLARVRRVASARGLTIADEAAGDATRVHGAAEIRKAALSGTPLLFLSPMFPTRSHPDWLPIEPMRAAALLRLAKAPVIALGGMDERRFRRVRRLGFSGWAGIGAYVRDGR
ncbi:MAG: thiamine phosphate synthase [Sphingomicrobium sp.]